MDENKKKCELTNMTSCKEEHFEWGHINTCGDHVSIVVPPPQGSKHAVWSLPKGENSVKPPDTDMLEFHSPIQTDPFAWSDNQGNSNNRRSSFQRLQVDKAADSAQAAQVAQAVQVLQAVQAAQAAQEAQVSTTPPNTNTTTETVAKAANAATAASATSAATSAAASAASAEKVASRLENAIAAANRAAAAAEQAEASAQRIEESLDTLTAASLGGLVNMPTTPTLPSPSNNTVSSGPPATTSAPAANKMWGVNSNGNPAKDFYSMKSTWNVAARRKLSHPDSQNAWFKSLTHEVVTAKNDLGQIDTDPTSGTAKEYDQFCWTGTNKAGVTDGWVAAGVVDGWGSNGSGDKDWKNVRTDGAKTDPVPETFFTSGKGCKDATGRNQSSCFCTAHKIERDSNGVQTNDTLLKSFDAVPSKARQCFVSELVNGLTHKTTRTTLCSTNATGALKRACDDTENTILAECRLNTN